MNLLNTDKLGVIDEVFIFSQITHIRVYDQEHYCRARVQIYALRTFFFRKKCPVYHFQQHNSR